DDAYDASFANVATPGDGGQCTTCTTTHETPPEPSDPDNADEPGLPDTGGTSLIPLGLGAGFLITGALLMSESRRRRQWVAVRIDPKR
ncbi:MAG TPA: LPXTG cell wall anchor domain-containing protein, partial [Microlunatus sp.]|nr:LPXTG cell wall anchor domain-containing protein [Microlunatus sp.]